MRTNRSCGQSAWRAADAAPESAGVAGSRRSARLPTRPAAAGSRRRGPADIDDLLANVDARIRSRIVRLETAGEADGHELAGMGAGGDVLDERIEQELGVTRTGRRLGVELDGEKGLIQAVNTFVTAIVRILEELLPIVG